ncbi:hypothetical protein [Bacterioplanoides sp.]|uniref:hypothetical protein n=1 Tax=Bacterioplanoides sp. TaxID=2066072 RepID=UPI003B5CC2DA
MAAYNTLLNLFHTFSALPLADAVKQLSEAAGKLPSDLQSQINAADLPTWAKAIHSARGEELSMEELTEGLGALARFSDDDIQQEVKRHFVSISVHIDTECMCEQYDVHGNEPAIELSFQQDDSPSPNMAENKTDVIPDCTIDWQFVPSRKEDTLELKAFYVGSEEGQSHCSAISAEAKMQYRSHESRTAGQPPMNYFFDFTINHGSQVFRIPAFTRDLVE